MLDKLFWFSLLSHAADKWGGRRDSREINPDTPIELSTRHKRDGPLTPTHYSLLIPTRYSLLTPQHYSLLTPPL